jgi:hypothetical protein
MTKIVWTQATSVATRALIRSRAIPSSSAASRVMSSQAPTTQGYGDGPLSYTVVPKDDMGKYKEYSVIFTNRSLNLMSDPFQKIMRDLNQLLKRTYNCEKVAIIPG